LRLDAGAGLGIEGKGAFISAIASCREFAPETQKALIRGLSNRQQAALLNLQQALNTKAGVLALQC
jgi:hypothetical protein